MAWLLDEVQRPFDLRDDPLIRVILAKARASKPLTCLMQTLRVHS